MTRQLVRYKSRSRFPLGQVARRTAGALISSRGNPYALAARGAGYLARYAGNQMYKAITYKGYKGRSAGSPAKKVTKVEPPAAEASAIGAPGGIDTVTLRVKVPKSKKFGALPKQCTNYWQDTRGIILANSGAQTVTCIAAVNTVQQIVASTGANYSFDQGFKSWFEMDPSFTNTGSQVVGGSQLIPANQNPGDHKYLLRSNRINLEITNTAGSAAIVDLYLCRCKKATEDHPDGSWNSGELQESVGLGLAPITNPGVQNSSGVGYPRTTMVGQHPNQVRQFRDFWKIVTTRRTQLSAGSSEIINFDINHPQVIKQEFVNSLYATGNSAGHSGDMRRYLPGSYVVMMVQRGQLAVDVTLGLNLPTYATTEIAYIANCFTSFGSRHDAAPRPKVNIITSRATVGCSTSNQKLLNQVILPVGINSTQVI